MATWAHISELADERAARPVRITGRITAVDGTRARIEDASGVTTILLGACRPPPLGAWVFVAGAWQNGAIAASRLDVVRAPHGEFPRVHGDWVWFHENQRRHLWMIERRAEITRGVRTFFDERGFLAVDTPLLVESPALDRHIDAYEVASGPERRWLATSPEHEMKRLLAAGLDRIYQIARCFRRSERGDLHQPEFSVLEWYRAFASAPALMQDTERLVASVARGVLGTTRVALRDGSSVDLAPPWRRLTLDDAFRDHADVAIDDVLPDEEQFFFLFATRVAPELGRGRPVFLTEWPPITAPLARRMRRRPHRADRFEAIVGGIELCNGFGELTDPLALRARLEREHAEHAARDGVRKYPIDERLLGALEEGMPPSAGAALGIDRLAMVLLGACTVDEVVAFSAARA